MARFLFLTALHALVGTSLASTDCFTQHSASLSELSKCGTSNTINACLSQIESYDQRDIASCFENAGCSIHEAKYETQQIIQRCQSFYEVKEIRKRATSTDSNEDSATTTDDSTEKTSTAKSSTAKSSTAKSSSTKSTSTEESTTEATSTEASSTEASTTVDASTTDLTSTASSTTASSTDSSTVESTTASSGTSNSMSGTACFTTHTKQTDICELRTTGGVTETATCTQGESLSSECAADRVCTTDSSGGDICMERQGIQLGGIIIASVFGAAALAFFGGLFFACFKGSQREKAAYTPLKT